MQSDSPRPSRLRNERQQELRVIDALTAASMVNTVAAAVAGVDTPWIEIISG